MNTAEFIYLLNHPHSTSNSQSLELESVLKEYPYFQSARILYLKSLHSQNNFKFNTQLKLTAVHTTDRSVLFDFINSEQFKVITPRIQSEDQTELIALENDTISNQDFEIQIEETTPNEEIQKIEQKLQQEIVAEFSDPEIVKEEILIPESPLEKSVMESILIANEKNEVEAIEYTNSDSNLQLENPLEKSILSSIKESETEEPQTKTNPDIFKEKTSWLEDSIDYDSTIVIETESASLPEETIEETIEETEEISEDSPIVDHSKSTTLSFQEWLQISKTKPIERTETEVYSEVIADTNSIEEDIPENDSVIEPKSEPATTEESIISEENTQITNSKMDLIDKFIETNPKIAPVKDHVPPPSYIVKKPDSPYLMTETLAKIYLEQKKYTKAIQAYEILILKYPEKSSLFADRILDIKDLQQNNNR